MQTAKNRIGYLEGGLSALINAALFGVKLYVGTAAGSVAMVADAWHTLSDTLTSVVVVFGFWISSRPRDEEHPFGHGRAERIAGIVIGTLLAVVGARFLMEASRQIRMHHVAVYPTVSIVVFAIATVLKEGLAQFSIRMGRRTNSPSLVADGWHHRSDAIASGSIVAGVFLGGSAWWLDGVLGVGVALLILYVAFDVIRDAATSLLGERPSSETVAEIERLATAIATPESIGRIHHVHMHRYGDHVELTLHARAPGATSLARAHRLASTLENRIRDELGYEATIHMETVEVEDG
jgi:cation diffusion facilitator family transporter